MKRLNCIELVLALASLTIATGRIGAAPVAPGSNGWTQAIMPYVTNATQIQVTVPAPVTGSRFYRLRKL